MMKHYMRATEGKSSGHLPYKNKNVLTLFLTVTHTHTQLKKSVNNLSSSQQRLAVLAFSAARHLRATVFDFVLGTVFS